MQLPQHKTCSNLLDLVNIFALVSMSGTEIYDIALLSCHHVQRLTYSIESIGWSKPFQIPMVTDMSEPDPRLVPQEVITQMPPVMPLWSDCVSQDLKIWNGYRRLLTCSVLPKFLHRWIVWSLNSSGLWHASIFFFISVLCVCVCVVFLKQTDT